MAYFDKYGVEFSDDSKTLVKCPKDFKGAYIIPNSVTSIGMYAFMGCSNLTSVMIPNSVTSIKHDAFFGCSSLTSVMIPNSVASIEHDAFAYCRGLTSVTIPNSVTRIENKAFSGCTSLTSVAIPNSVTRIEQDAFSSCTSLTSVMIPNSVTRIEQDAFYGCSSLFSVTIPNSVTSIGDYAFYNCTGLASISIGNSVTSIGDDAFHGCTSLTSIVVGNDNSVYDSRNDCNAIVETASNTLIAGCQNTIIQNSITSIGSGAFSGCTSLTSVMIPNSVTSIGFRAFYKCSGLTSVAIPNSVTSIGESAFSGCTSLTSVTIPNSVTSIGNYAFCDCSNLKEIIVPFSQKERFCVMDGLKGFADIIKQKAILRQREEEQQRRMQEQQLQEIMQGSILFFDTETTGTPRNYKALISDSYNWPRLVQLAWIMADKNGNVVKKKSVIIKPDGFSIPSDASAIHGITTERALREGKPLKEVLDEFTTDLSFASQIVGHNIDFDQHIVGAELYRLNMDYSALMYKSSTCTMKSSTNYCAIPNPNSYYGGYKWPSLSELYWKLFGRSFGDAHDALADITATKDCYYELKRKGIL